LNESYLTINTNLQVTLGIVVAGCYCCGSRWRFDV